VQRLKIPKPRDRIPSQKKTHSANHACLTKKSDSYESRTFGEAQNSICLEQEISIFKENRQRKPCVPNETICNPIVQEYLDKLKIPNASSKNFPLRKKTDSANHAWLTKQSNSN